MNTLPTINANIHVRHGKALLEHFWDEAVTHWINWASIEHRIKISSPSDRQCNIKLIHRIFHSCCWANCFNNQTSPHCPSCPCTMEDQKHIFSCPSRLRHSLRAKNLATFKCTLQQLNTAPDMLALMCDAIKQWENNPTHTPTVTFCSNDTFGCTVQEVVLNQLDIGWEQFLHGITSLNWNKAQQLYYD